MKKLALALVVPAAVLLESCGGAPIRLPEPRGPRAPVSWPVSFARLHSNLPAGWEAAGDAPWEAAQHGVSEPLFHHPPMEGASSSPTWLLRPNPGENQPPSDSFLLWKDHRLADGRITVCAHPVLQSGLAPWGILVRSGGPGSGLLVRVNPADRNLRIHKLVTGEPKILAGRAVAMEPAGLRGSSALRLTVEFRGERLTATLDGNPPLTVDDEDAGEAGQVGLYAGGDQRVEFTQVEIVELPGPRVRPP